MLFNTFSFASKQTSSFGKNQHDRCFFSFCKDLCRGQGHRRSCASSKFNQKTRRGQSWVLRQVHTETAICTDPRFPKEQVSPSCSLTSSIPRSILKSDGSSFSLLQPLLTLRVPLNLMAGSCSCTPIRSALPHTKQLGAPSQKVQDLHLETKITCFVPFI